MFANIFWIINKKFKETKALMFSFEMIISSLETHFNPFQTSTSYLPSIKKLAINDVFWHFAIPNHGEVVPPLS